MKHTAPTQSSMCPRWMTVFWSCYHARQTRKMKKSWVTSEKPPSSVLSREAVSNPVPLCSLTCIKEALLSHPYSCPSSKGTAWEGDPQNGGGSCPVLVILRSTAMDLSEFRGGFCFKEWITQPQNACVREVLGYTSIHAPPSLVSCNINFGGFSDLPNVLSSVTGDPKLGTYSVSRAVLPLQVWGLPGPSISASGSYHLLDLFLSYIHF